MGRYYKTATPQSMDFMYKLPENLMFKVAQQASDDITQNQAAVYDLYGKLQLPAIENDKEEAKALLSGYENKINDIAKTLQDNPLEFRRKSGEIIGLAREMGKDFSSGKAANISSRYASMGEWEKRQYENKDIKDKQAILAMKADILRRDKQAGGLRYNPVTGTGSSLPVEELYGTIDLSKQFMDRADKIVAQVTASGGADKDGKYIYTWNNKTERRTPEQIRDVLYREFLADKDTQNYIQQRSKIGTMSGWTNKDGSFMLPTWENIKDKKGNVVAQKDIWQEGSAFKQLIDANIGRYALFNSERTSNIKSDGSYATDMALKMKTNVVDIKTGVQSVNPFGVDPTSTTPYQDMQKKITDLQAAGIGKFDSTQAEFEDVLLGLTNLSGQQKQELTSLSREALESAKQGDFSQFKDLYKKAEKMGAVIGTQAYKQTIEGIEHNLRTANTVKAQIKTYETMAEKKLQDAGIGYTDADLARKTNELMASARNNQNMSTNETSGDIMVDPVDKALYQDSLDKIGKSFADGRIPDWVVVSEKNANGEIVNTRMSGKDLQEKKYYKDFSARQKTTTTYVDAVAKETDGKSNSPLAQKVFQTIGYGLDDEAIVDPIAIQISDNVSILVDKDKYGSETMNKIENKNRLSINISTSIQDAILKTKAINSVAREEKVIPEYQPFELLGKDIIFTPNNDKGLITVILDGVSYTKPSDDQEIRKIMYDQLSK